MVSNCGFVSRKVANKKTKRDNFRCANMRKCQSSLSLTQKLTWQDRVKPSIVLSMAWICHMTESMIIIL